MDERGHDMIELLAFLDNNPQYTDVDVLYSYKLPEGTKDITHIYAKCGNWSICVTAPHSGTGGRFLLRANPTATLDRWSTADYETLLGSWMDVARELDYQNFIYGRGDVPEEEF